MYFFGGKPMPKITKKPLDKVIPTRLNSKDYEELINNAKQQRLTVTALLRKLVLEYLDELKTNYLFNK